MWDLVVSPPLERPSAWSLPPFSGRRLLMGADDGAVDHQILVVAVGGERVEHPLPYAGMAPPAETPMDALPPTVALRQVAPMCTWAQNPQTSVHEQSVIRSRSARIACLAGQQQNYPRPLRFGELVPLDPHPFTPRLNTEPYESDITPVVYPECQSALERQNLKRGLG